MIILVPPNNHLQCEDVSEQNFLTAYSSPCSLQASTNAFLFGTQWKGVESEQDTSLSLVSLLVEK